MNRKKVVTIISIVSIASILSMSFMLTSAKAGAGHGSHDEKAGKNENPKGLTLDQIQSQHLPKISQAIEKAIKAIETDNKETALIELHKAEKMLEAIAIIESKSESVESLFANVRCPIMTANNIDPAKVTKNLIRDYKGQKIAFCCGGCPPRWDKLSDAEKADKLSKSI